MQNSVTCPFCRRRVVKPNTTYIFNGVLFETAVSYVECSCGAVYAPERLRANHGEVDEGD